MDVLSNAYDETVSEWRAQGISDRASLAAALVDYRVRFAYNSGKIENDAITYHDTREVFESGRAIAFTGNVRTLFEIQNQRECHELLLDAYEGRRPIDETLLLEVHRTLTQGTYDERRWERGERPGSYKRHAYVVVANEAGSPPDDVIAGITELLDELSAATPENALTVAAYFHAKLESIHPFADGNGRVGRALMNYLLALNDHPPIIVYDEDKLAYYGAFRTWDEEADLLPFAGFLRAETVKTWRHGL